MNTAAHRYHDISCGHRVLGHESKCAHAHGHNYRVHFECAGEVDTIGRVLDFAVMKERLCMWVEQNWDHRFLLCAADPWVLEFGRFDPLGLVVVPFNPTAEGMAEHLVRVVGPLMLLGTGVTLVRCVVEETRKCSASYALPD